MKKKTKYLHWQITPHEMYDISMADQTTELVANNSLRYAKSEHPITFQVIRAPIITKFGMKKKPHTGIIRLRHTKCMTFHGGSNDRIGSKKLVQL
jgi:hypothetical protein